MSITCYYTLNTATGELERLVPPITVDGRLVLHPTDEEAALYGAYRREPDESPTPPEGKLVEPDGWEVRDGAWHRRWRFDDAPLPALDAYDAAMEDHLALERSARGYTTREPDAYLSSANPRWAQDARDWVAHRDAVMVYALELINDVQARTIPQPTLAEFRANLPQITWTYQEDS